jgi:hypothetical protein
MNIKKAQKRLDALYSMLREEVGSSTIDLIYELVELEISLERENNR